MHQRFTEWARQYGGIYALKRFTNTTVVISDPGLVKELLGRRSSLYSHRPASHVGRLITRGEHLLLMQYGDEWRRLRKTIHQFFAEQQCDKRHVRLQNAEAAQLVHDFLVAPEDHMLHPKRYSNSITNSLGLLRSSFVSLLFWECWLIEKVSQSLASGREPYRMTT